MPCYDSRDADDCHDAKESAANLLQAVNKLTDIACRLCHTIGAENLPLDISSWFAVHVAWDDIRKERGLDAPKCH